MARKYVKLTINPRLTYIVMTPTAHHKDLYYAGECRGPNSSTRADELIRELLGEPT